MKHKDEYAFGPGQSCKDPAPSPRLAGAPGDALARCPGIHRHFTAATRRDLAGALVLDDVAGNLLLAFAIFFAFLGHAMLIFCKHGREQALALGLLVAERNPGLMPAATAGGLPSATWLYLALGSFRLNLRPQLLQSIARAKT
jgi:BASS family bile acid:Na+ symporter